MKTCPSCQRETDDAAARCECGYNYQTGFVEPKWLTEGAPSTRDRSAFEVRGDAGADGSLAGGIFLGLICGCFGLAIAYFGKMGPETKRGAVIGFVISAVLTVLLRFRYG